MDSEYLAESLKREAQRLGFDFCGITSVVEPTGYSNLCRWIDAGYAGEMHYFDKRREAYQSADQVLKGVASVVMLGTHYQPPKAMTSEVERGRVAAYAAIPIDYHEVLWERLTELGRHWSELDPTSSWRGVVDTAPLLEREFALLAGLGWQAKNTLLIHPRRGSYFLLSAFLTERALPSDEEFATNHCGTCRRCLEACPTNAFVAPNLLDATRCISYLTIEHRSAIPAEMRPLIGDWVFGCDVCQVVCPWNRFAPDLEPRNPLAGDPGLKSLSLVDLFELDETQFRSRFRKTALWRAKRRGLLRNAAIVLGNQRHSQSVPALARGLADVEPLVRGAAAWALGQIPVPASYRALTERLDHELEESVREEILAALIHLNPMA